MTINANAGEYRSRVGLDNLCIAEVLQDDASAYLAETPEYFAPAAEASQEPAVNRTTQYADDQPFDAMSAEGETTIQLTVTNIPIEMLAKITGRPFDAASGRMLDNGGTPPYMALLFRSKKSNGSFRYYCYPKGRFDMPGEEAATQSDSPDPKTVQLTFTAVKTVHKFDLGSVTDGVKRIVGDTDTTNFDTTGWFNQVQTPAVAAPSALSLSSSVPVDAATGVSVSADITLTFNNALANSAVNNVTILSSTGALVAVVKTLNATKKVMTINPNADLAAGAEYTVVISGVTDVFGQTLTDTITFTTAE